MTAEGAKPSPVVVGVGGVLGATAWPVQPLGGWSVRDVRWVVCGVCNRFVAVVAPRRPRRLRAERLRPLVGAWVRRAVAGSLVGRRRRWWLVLVVCWGRRPGLSNPWGVGQSAMCGGFGVSFLGVLLLRAALITSCTRGGEEGTLLPLGGGWLV